MLPLVFGDLSIRIGVDQAMFVVILTLLHVSVRDYQLHDILDVVDTNHMRTYLCLFQKSDEAVRIELLVLQVNFSFS